MNKIPIYFIPGLAANTLIFEKIKLDSQKFSMHFIEWKLPLENESITEYSKRLALEIKHEKPVLIGVSFGGIIAQEINKIIEVRKTIIISSVKSNEEFPDVIKWGSKYKAHKLLPYSFVKHIEKIIPEFINRIFFKSRLKLYSYYLSERDSDYLKWSVEKIVDWQQTKPQENIIHIHGNKDDIFPIKYIKDCIVVNGGTHALILQKYRWLNEHLPKLILQN